MKINPISYVLPEDDPLDIRKDLVFKAVFTKNTPESTGALSNLVSALIGRKVSVVSILANEPPPQDIRDRQIRYDINCKVENGELINVEMTFEPAKYEPVRLEFHIAKLYIGQNIKGTDKTFDDLQQAYQISILAEERVFKDDEAFFHSFEYYDPVNKVSLNGRTQIITLELRKLDGIVEKPADEMSVSERWAVYFEYLTDREKRGKINEILEREEGIAMASEVLMTISRDDEERARIYRDEKIILDYQSGLVHAKREAKREGAEEEREKNYKEKLDNARSALSEGIPVETVQRIFGLDLETIKAL